MVTVFLVKLRVVSNRLTQLRRPLQLALCQLTHIALGRLPGLLALKGPHLHQLLLKGPHLSQLLFDSLRCPLHCLVRLSHLLNFRLLELDRCGIIPKTQGTDELRLLNAGHVLFHESTILVFKKRQCCNKLYTKYRCLVDCCCEKCKLKKYFNCGLLAIIVISH